jgi:hypothetical protein
MEARSAMNAAGTSRLRLGAWTSLFGFSEGVLYRYRKTVYDEAISAIMSAVTRCAAMMNAMRLHRKLSLQFVRDGQSGHTDASLRPGSELGRQSFWRSIASLPQGSRAHAG